jgi:hypothetical protein
VYVCVVLHGHGGGLVADLGLVFGLPATRCTSAPRVGAVESPSALTTSPVSRLSLSSHIDNLPALSYLLPCALARFTVQIFTFVQSASSCNLGVIVLLGNLLLDDTERCETT